MPSRTSAERGRTVTGPRGAQGTGDGEAEQGAPGVQRSAGGHPQGVRVQGAVKGSLSGPVAV